MTPDEKERMEKEWEVEKAAITKIVDECVSKIKEHVDAVQVHVSHHNSDLDNTMSYERGGGNMHTRLGVVKEWLDTQRQYVKNWAIRNDKRDED